jgi:hephaestin
VPQSVKLDDEEFVESNLMHSINGYVYGNLPGLTMNVGERVRWYMLGMGTEVDLHTPHWHGNTGTWAGMRSDIVELLPASMKVFDMTPDADGTWLFHCHVNDHISAGMLALYTVNP